MKVFKICIMVLLIISVGTIAQAQQSEFQGTWIGEKSERVGVDRSAYRLEIIGNRWQQFYNNEIDAAGTARFSAGRAELLLADGRVAWDLRLLAPGLIEQPISIWDGFGYYRFRRVQPSSNSQNNPQLDTQNISTPSGTYRYSDVPSWTITFGTGTFTMFVPASISPSGKNITANGTFIVSGKTVLLTGLDSPLVFTITDSKTLTESDGVSVWKKQ